jgi:hypothetical protein
MISLVQGFSRPASKSGVSTPRNGEAKRGADFSSTARSRLAVEIPVLAR